MNHVDRVTISKQAMAIALTTQLYDNALLERQRLMRELKRIMARVDENDLEILRHEKILKQFNIIN